MTKIIKLRKRRNIIQISKVIYLSCLIQGGIQYLGISLFNLYILWQRNQNLRYLLRMN